MVTRIAALEHLGRGFGEPGLVAVQRRQGQGAGEGGGQGDERRQQRSAPTSPQKVQAVLGRHGPSYHQPVRAL